MLEGLPSPVRDEDTTAFWEACDRGELVVQQCSACRSFWWPPGPVCPACGSFEHEWTKVAGRASLYSWVVVEVPLAAGLEDQIPYAVGLVELDEGVRIVTTISGCEPASLEAGMRLRVEFGQPATSIFTFLPA